MASRWLVWLGGLTLAVGGIFLARYAIEQGFLGPATRLGLAVALGLSLVGVGEVLRRRPLAQGLARLRPDQVPASLVAAGLFIALAAVYAAYALNTLIGGGTAFALMAALSLMGVALALLHGPFVALLSFATGLAIPALIPSDSPSLWSLLAWLLALNAAALFTARRLASAWLGWPLLAGFLFWAAALVVLGSEQEEPWPGILFGLAVPAMAFLASHWRRAATVTEGRQVQAFAAVALTAALFGAALDDWSRMVTLGFGLTALLALGLARARPALDRLAPAAASLCVVGMALCLIPVATGDQGPSRLLIPAAFAGGLLLAGAAGMVGAARPVVWAATAAIPPLLIAALSYAVGQPLIPGIAWTGVGLVLLAALAGLAVLTWTRAGDKRTSSADIFAGAATAAAAMVLATQLEQAVLTVGLALLVPALAALARRVPLPALGWCAGAVAGVVLVRLLLNPVILDYPLSGPVHWIAWGYGVPALALYAGSRLLPDAVLGWPRTLLRAGALALAVVLPTLEIQAYSQGTLQGDWLGLLQTSLRSALWLTVAAVLARRGGDSVASHGSLVLAVLGAAQTVLLQLGLLNPLWSGEPVGPWPVLNLLLLAYLAPVPLLLLAARAHAAQGARRAMALGLSLVLLFTWASLTLRQAFQGTDLSLDRGTGDTEWYAYSVLWLAFALGLLVLGIRRHLPAARHASLAVLLLTVGKVFLSDMADLEGLLRILSFFGLGACLIGIGWLYQRFVFPPKRAA